MYGPTDELVLPISEGRFNPGVDQVDRPRLPQDHQTNRCHIHNPLEPLLQLLSPGDVDRDTVHRGIPRQR